LYDVLLYLYVGLDNYLHCVGLYLYLHFIGNACLYVVLGDTRHCSWMILTCIYMFHFVRLYYVMLLKTSVFKWTVFLLMLSKIGMLVQLFALS